MISERLAWDGNDARAKASELRAAAAPPSELRETVAAIIESVASRGDAAVLELTARLDATDRPPESLPVSSGEAAAAAESLPPELLEAMRLALANVRAVAEAELAALPPSVELEQGHRVSLVESPVAAAGLYVPGGRAAYPSSVLMACAPARAAGVPRIALASPPGPDGRIAASTLAAASLCEPLELYAMGGAQAVAALVLGTESVAPVDVIAGPGNAYVTEAKRQLFGRAGVDGLAGPSELVVIADALADHRAIALDLLAQAEHGLDSPLVAIAVDDGTVELIEAAIGELAPGRPTATAARLALVEAPDLDAALRLSDAVAPEHLELRFAGADEELAGGRVAGAVFVGAGPATAFGDYAAGSNHILPTGGAARFAGPLGPRAFLRRTSVVSIDERAARALAGPVDLLARAEGLPVHGESALATGAGAPPAGGERG